MPKFNSTENTCGDLDSMLNGVSQLARKNDWTAENAVDANGVRTLTVVLTPRADRLPVKSTITVKIPPGAMEKAVAEVTAKIDERSKELAEKARDEAAAILAEQLKKSKEQKDDGTATAKKGADG